MRIWPLSFLVAVAVAGLLASVARAADPAASYEALFGNEERAAQATKDLRKLAAFSKRLLDAAAATTDDAPFQAHVYAKAVEFGLVHAEGYATAAAAAAGLARADPRQSNYANAKLLAAREGLYRTAPEKDRKAAAAALVDQALAVAEIEIAGRRPEEALAVLSKVTGPAANYVQERNKEVLGRVREATARVAVQKKVDALREALRIRPDDVRAATEYVELVLIEADEPKLAERFVDRVDEALQAPAALAVKPLAQLTEDETLQLADFYRGKTAKATEVGKTNAWRRVRALGQRVLETHAKKDATFLRAELAVGDAEKALAALDAAAGRASDIDLLSLIQLPADTIKGAATMPRPAGGGRGSLTVGTGTQVRVPYQVADEFDLRVKFTKQPGDGMVVYIKQADRRIGLNIANWGGTVVGVDGLTAKGVLEGPATVRGLKLEAGKDVALLFQVRRTSVAILLEGKELVRIKTDFKEAKDPLPDGGPATLIVTHSFGTVVIKELVITELGGARGKRLSR